MAGPRHHHFLPMAPSEVIRLKEIYFFRMMKNLFKSEELKNNKAIEMVENIMSLYKSNCNPGIISAQINYVLLGTSLLAPNIEEEIVLNYRAGEGAAAISRRLNVHVDTVYRKLKQYSNSGQPTFLAKTDPRTQEEIIKFVAQVAKFIKYFHVGDHYEPQI